MSAAEPAAANSGSAASWRRRSPAIFAATLFVSALLLFSVQPMFAKLVLPKLGGAPAIWSVAMVFFQGALLLGYAYAHYLTRALPLRAAALVHFGLLGLAALSLPLGIASSFGRAPHENIELWLLALFSASIGLPFMALAATAPLLQRWFAGSDHPMAANPYVLYGASNLGSFAALLSYPLLVEPLMTLHAQAAAWSLGYGLLAALIAVCVLSIGRTVKIVPVEIATKADWRAIFSWIALASVPSGLVVAVTAYISTDVAAAPFLWVIPLALYLLTFVATFRQRPWISHATVALAAPFLVVPLAASMQGGEPAFWFVTIALHLAAFFVLTLLCHGALYQRRPAPGQLTTFYLAISVGGLIGGAFAGLIAPRLFATTAEYPILIAAALLALPGALSAGAPTFFRRAAPAVAAALTLVALHYVVTWRIPLDWMIAFQAALILIAALALFTVPMRRGYSDWSCCRSRLQPTGSRAKPRSKLRGASSA